jgi:uncharacterized oligopeptide transporter (OPT) family protein
MGAPIGAAALAIVYPALVKTYGLIGEHAGLAAPGSRRMAGFAELLSGGVSKLPVTAMWAMLAAVVLGIVFAIMETQPRLKRWSPSPTGLSLGLLLPFSSLASMFIGAVAGWAWQKANPKSAQAYLIPLASGLIAGEAMVAVIVPVLLWLGLGHP